MGEIPTTIAAGRPSVTLWVREGIHHYLPLLSPISNTFHLLTLRKNQLVPVAQGCAPLVPCYAVIQTRKGKKSHLQERSTCSQTWSLKIRDRRGAQCQALWQIFPKRIPVSISNIQKSKAPEFQRLIVCFLKRKTKYTKSTLLLLISSSQNIKSKTTRNYVFNFSHNPDCIYAVSLIPLTWKHCLSRDISERLFPLWYSWHVPFLHYFKTGMGKKKPAKLKTKTTTNCSALRMPRPVSQNCLLIIALWKIVYKMNRKF